MIALALGLPSVPAQHMEAALVDGQPALKYTDKNGCESPINFGKIGGEEEAIMIRVIHFHGIKWGDKGWLGITRSRIFFRPDSGQKDEHAFSMSRGALKEANVAKNGKVYYLKIKSEERKNQEFAIDCFGSTRDADDTFVPILNHAALACNDFDAGANEFQRLTSKLQPRKSEDATVPDLLRTSPKALTSDSPVGIPKGQATGDAERFLDAVGRLDSVFGELVTKTLPHQNS